MKLVITSFRRELLILGLILLFGMLFLPVVIGMIEEKEREASDTRLEKAHEQALVTFRGGIERFATLMSGIRSYMVSSPEFPTQSELRHYVAYQLRDINYAENLTISFIDTSHVFRYSFDRRSKDPGRLIGTSVKSIRDQDEIDRLNGVLNDEQLHLFKPINLVEGYVGLPINFSIIRDGQVCGYIAAIIDFSTLVAPLYEVYEGKEEFAYHFSVEGLLDFDRSQVYDGSRVYHNEVDSAFYQHYNLAKSSFKYSTLDLYNLEFMIGSAAVGEIFSGATKDALSTLLYVWYFLLITFFAFSVYRLIRFRQLNIRLNESNQTIRVQTEQLESQNAKLKKVVHTKDKLFSIIGHDLKGPLTSLITIVSLAESNKISVDETRSFIHDAGAAAKHNLDLLDNLLRWSMQNSGADQIRKTSFKLFELASSTKDQLQVVASTKNLHIVNEVDEKLMLHADYQMISTVLRNLISNAIKFSFPGRSITIGAREEGGKAVVSVSDSGVGMNEEELNALFQAGTDVVRRGTNDEPGTGLGLVVVNDFIQRHKGELKVYSEEGKGSTFEVWLPNGWYIPEELLQTEFELSN